MSNWHRGTSQNFHLFETEAALWTQATLGDVLQQLTPEERRQFAELVPRRGPHGREARRERAPRGPDSP